MEENGMTKIYCGNRENNDALYALLAQKNNNDPLAMMAAMGGGMGGGMWNNPFIYLVWMMYAQRMWNQNGNNDEIQNQLTALRTQMQDNQNTNALMDAVKGNSAQLGDFANRVNCDINALSQAICDVRSAIMKVGGDLGLGFERTINAVISGRADVIQQLQNCCCNLRESIASLRSDLQLQMCRDTSDLRNGQRDITAAITQGFASTAFQAQQDKCDIIRSGENNTQRIIDTLNNHWSAEDKLKIQDLKFELSQERQTRQLEDREHNLLVKLINLINSNGGNGGAATV